MSAHLGDREKAHQLIESVRPDSGAQLPMMAGVAEILALIGEMDEANLVVNAFNLLSPDTRISRFRQALLTLALGNKRESLSLLLKPSKIEKRNSSG